MRRIAVIIMIVLLSFFISCNNGGGDSAVSNLYTISYDRNGAETGNVPTNQNGNEDVKQAISGNIGNLSKNGYLFEGWNTKADGTGRDYAPGFSYSGKDLKLYAKWAAIYKYEIINSSPVSGLDDSIQRIPGKSNASITGLTNSGRLLSSFDIPDTIDGHTVSSISDNAFSGCTNITSMTLPETISAIGDNAFSGCAYLANLVLSSFMPPVIGGNALYGCSIVVIIVPAFSINNYSGYSGWSDYSGSMTDGTKNFQVVFNNDGEQYSVKFVEPPEENVGSLPTPPKKNGYIFGGWWTERNGGGTEFTASTSVTGGMMVYAKWNSYDYTVTFNSQDATTPPSFSTASVKSPNTTIGSLPSDPKNDGYAAFGGWWTQPDGGTEFTADTPVTGDITVYAHWSSYNYKVTFNSQDATTEPSFSTTYVASPKTTIVSLPTPPERNGYAFGGWWTEKNGGGTEFTAGTLVTGDITVYAYWGSHNYKVTFNSQGATTEPSFSTTYVASPKITVGTMPTNPEKDDYAFGGWWTQPDGGTEFTTSTVVTEDIIVYAHWEYWKHTVTFDSQGATTEPSFSTTYVASPKTTVVSLPTNPKNNGYEFGGWWTGRNGAGTEFTADTPVTSNITVYAKWSSYNYTVIFDSQGATTEPSFSTTYVASPKTTVASLPTEPKYNGYEFGGWWTGRNGAGTEFTADTPVTSNITVYAKWNSYNYTVIFDSQGATTEPSFSTTYVASPKTTVASLPTNPKNNGYEFGGWWTGKNGAGTEFTAGTPVTGNITVYAKWNSYSYKVTFNPMNGNSVIEKTVSSPATTVDSLPADPEKDTNSFKGWWTGQNGTGTEFTADTPVTGNITVYAKWESYFTYSISNNKLTITGLTETGKAKLNTNLNIPNEINGLPVVSIGNYAFYNNYGEYNNNDFTGTLTIPDSVTSIGTDAFDSCSFTKLKLGNIVTNIDERAFAGCKGLTNITFPDSVTSIGAYAFSGCIGLNSITIPDSVTSIGACAFCDCTGLSNVTLGSGIINLKANIFEGCECLLSITVDNNNSSYCSVNGVVYNKSKSEIIMVPNGLLGKFVIPDNVTSIGTSAFSGCIGLTSITIPDSVTNIGSEAFRNCKRLTNIIIPDSVTSLGIMVFFNCTGLTSAKIGNGVTSLGQQVFGYCSNLTSITIPDSVISISNAFTDCRNLSSIEIGKNVTSIGGNAFSSCALTNLTIPDSVTSLGGALVQGCPIRNITIGKSVTNIDSGAFYDCGVETLNFNAINCAKMGDNEFPAFYNCSSLRTINIGNEVKIIPPYAFCGCANITRITIPNNVESIGNQALKGCSNLTNIKIESTIPPTLNSGVFVACSKLDSIQVPSAAVETYKSAPGWSIYADMITGY